MDDLLFWVWVHFFLIGIKSLRIEDAVCRTDCKVLWVNFEILCYTNKTDLTWICTFRASSLQTSSSSSHCRQWVTTCRAPWGSSSTANPPPWDTPVCSYRLTSGRKGQSDGRVGPVSSGRRWELIQGLRPRRASWDTSTDDSRWARWVRKQPRIDGSWTQASLRREPTVWREGDVWCRFPSWSFSSPSSTASGPPLWPSLEGKQTNLNWVTPEQRGSEERRTSLLMELVSYVNLIQFQEM